MAKASEALIPASRPPLARLRPTIGRLRLVTGLWLLLFAATHLANHALGLVSVGTAEAGRAVFLAFWRQPAVEASLAAALLVHIALGLWKLWQRRTLRMRPAELAQLGLALLIPSYLTVHVLGTGWLHRCCGVDDSYHYLLSLVWPGGARAYTILTLAVWLHAMIGLHQWLRLRPGYAALQPWLLVVATLLPVLALGGFLNAGREVARWRADQPQAVESLAALQDWAPEALRAAMVYGPERWIVQGFMALVVVILALRLHPLAVAAPTQCAPGLPRRPAGERAARPHHPRSQPGRGRAARGGLRRPWPLLDLPRAGGQGCRAADRPRSGGAAPAGPDRRAARRAAGLPDPPICRPRPDATDARDGGTGRCVDPPAAGSGRGTRDRRPVLRSARLHQPVRGPPALRHGVRPQPLLQGHGRGDRGGGRSGRQVHRRRDHGAVRPGRRHGRRRAGGAGGGARHVRRPGTAEPRPRGRTRPAVADGHRPASGAGDPGRDGAWRRQLADRHRRHRQRREPARGADQGSRLRGDRLGASGRARWGQPCGLRAARRRCAWP